MTLGELARVLSANAMPAEVHGDGRVGFSSVSTDSRTLSDDALFVALSGERFDGHDYVARAHENGAVAALVERRVDAEVPQLIVADSKRAFGIAAGSWRARFSLPVIAVAGSNGKTTVTQMIAAILGAAYGEKNRLATRGNLNNDIGVPLMLWQLSKQHRAAVFELGMNHPGRDCVSDTSGAADCRAGQQRTARASGIHAVGRGDRIRKRRSPRGIVGRWRRGVSGG